MSSHSETGSSGPSSSGKDRTPATSGHTGGDAPDSHSTTEASTGEGGAQGLEDGRNPLGDDAAQESKGTSGVEGGSTLETEEQPLDTYIATTTDVDAGRRTSKGSEKSRHSHKSNTHSGHSHSSHSPHRTGDNPHTKHTKHPEHSSHLALTSERTQTANHATDGLDASVLVTPASHMRVADAEGTPTSATATPAAETPTLDSPSGEPGSTANAATANNSKGTPSKKSGFLGTWLSDLWSTGNGNTGSGASDGVAISPVNSAGSPVGSRGADVAEISVTHLNTGDMQLRRSLTDDPTNSDDSRNIDIADTRSSGRLTPSFGRYSRSPSTSRDDGSAGGNTGSNRREHRKMSEYFGFKSKNSILSRSSSKSSCKSDSRMSDDADTTSGSTSDKRENSTGRKLGLTKFHKRRRHKKNSGSSTYTTKSTVSTPTLSFSFSADEDDGNDSQTDIGSGANSRATSANRGDFSNTDDDRSNISGSINSIELGSDGSINSMEGINEPGRSSPILVKSKSNVIPILDRLSSSPSPLDSMNDQNGSNTGSTASPQPNDPYDVGSYSMKNSKSLSNQDAKSEAASSTKSRDSFFKRLSTQKNKLSTVGSADDVNSGSAKTLRQQAIESVSVGNISESPVLGGSPLSTPSIASPSTSSMMSTASKPSSPKKGHAKRSSVTSLLFRKSSVSDSNRSDSFTRKTIKVPEEDLMMANLMQLCVHLLPPTRNEKRSDRVVDLLSACATFAGEDVALAWWYNWNTPTIYVCSTTQSTPLIVEYLEDLLKLFIEAVDIFTRTQDFGFELRLVPSIGPERPASNNSVILTPNRSMSVDSNKSDESRRDSTDTVQSTNSDHSGISYSTQPSNPQTNDKYGDTLSPSNASTPQYGTPTSKKAKQSGAKTAQQLLSMLEFTIPSSGPGDKEGTWESKLMDILLNGKNKQRIIKEIQEGQASLDIFKKLRISDFRAIVFGKQTKSALLGQLKTRGKKMPSDNYLISYMKSHAKASGDTAKYQVYIERYIEWLEGIQISIGKLKPMNATELYNFCRLFFFSVNSISFEYVYKTIVALYGSNSRKIGVTTNEFQQYVTKVGSYYQHFQTIFKSISQKDFAGVIKTARLVPVICHPTQVFKVKPWSQVFVQFGFSQQDREMIGDSVQMDRYPVGKMSRMPMDAEAQLMEYIWKRHYIGPKRRFLCHLGCSKPSMRMTWEMGEILKDYGAHFQMGEIAGEWEMWQVPKLSIRLQGSDIRRLGIDEEYAFLDMKDEIISILRDYFHYFLESQRDM